MVENAVARQPSPARDRMYEIDALRIFAAVAVVVYHYTFANAAGALTTVRYDAISPITRYGYLGVDLFFMISGFVVLLSAIGRRPTQFVTSRIVRLYPAYWVAVTITAATLAWFGRDILTVTPAGYLANLTMFNSLVDVENIDVVYWTLWAELRFYALVFVLTLVGITQRRVLAVLWAWLAASFLLAANVLPGPVQALAELALQPDWSHYFIAGMAMCLLYRYGRSWQAWTIIAVAFGRALWTAVDFAAAVGDRYQERFHTVAVLGVIAAVFAVMLAVALRTTRRWGRPWFVALGALTYPLYLVHDRVGVVLYNALDGWLDRWTLLALITAAMLALAWLIHRWVERPLAPRLKTGLNRLEATARLRTARRQLARRQPAGRHREAPPATTAHAPAPASTTETPGTGTPAVAAPTQTS
jgi:peptidoglycan/LPS O-acetylase OafA/YrhL